ncbi:hypothetical protein A2U01_0015414 [Trifolium medium]|uniref:Uncharacterized protein n=1 Tax=Trifolium medium TaxID=97028 RepID=A0A392N7I9_9FABA|nr:hypothetical protein [Trifolium medium]
MFRLGWGYGGNGWRWHMQLFAWGEELWGKCCSVLANVLLQVDIPDEWEWLPNLEEGYSDGAYFVLTSSTETERNIHCDLIWNKQRRY